MVKYSELFKKEKKSEKEPLAQSQFDLTALT